MELSDYCRQFAHLRTNRNRTHWTADTCYCAPHKPLLLLAVMDLIAEGSIKTNLIEPSARLGERFEQYWRLVVPPHRGGNLAMPFVHLESDGFWHLVPKPGNPPVTRAWRGYSLRHLQGVLLGAKLDDKLFTLFCRETARLKLRSVLVTSFFVPHLQMHLVRENGAGTPRQQSRVRESGPVYETNTATQFQRAAEYARQGKRKQALQALVAIVRDNPRHAEAWYLLSSLVNDKEKRLDCLRHTLMLVPDHEQAKKQLQALTAIAPGPVQPPGGEQLGQGSVSEHSEEDSFVAPGTEVLEDAGSQGVPARKLSDGTRASLPAPARHPPVDLSHRLWQVDNEADWMDPEALDVVKLLIDDVSRLPIISNPHQELFLGVQLRAPKRLSAIVARWKKNGAAEPFAHFFGENFVQAWAQLEGQCVTHKVPAPKLDLWIYDLLAARRDIYSFHRSRLRRFIRRVQALTDINVAAKILEPAYEVVEILASLPGNLLGQVADYVSAHDRLPPIAEMTAQFGEEPRVLQHRASVRAKHARQTLTTGYLRYALRVAQGQLQHGLEYADLAQAGFMGLMRAARKFDYTVQARFGTYATSWIWQAIGREISDHGSTIRLPVHLRETLRKWESACSQYDDGILEPVRNPAVLFQAGFLEEIDYNLLSQAAPLSRSVRAKVDARYQEAVAKALKLLNRSVQVLPLSSLRVAQTPNTVDDRRLALAEVTPDPQQLEFHTAQQVEFVHKMIEEEWFVNLTSIEREVLELRYGWDGGEEHTLQEIGRLYGLSRERIRQIQAKALARLKKRVGLDRIGDLLRSVAPSPPPLAEEIWSRLDLEVIPTLEGHGFLREGHIVHLLKKLPHSDWVQGRSGTTRVTMQEELVAALQALAAPSHVTDITEQLNGETVSAALKEAAVYSLLIRNEATFILLGQRVFSLVAWEEKRAQQFEPILPYCPLPLPDPPDYEDAFFESVLVGKRALTPGLTASQFLLEMFNWAKTDLSQQKWLKQSVLTTYYLVGLIPYAFHYGGEDPVLKCMLPEADIQALRYHCLGTLTRRLKAMPEFWWLLQRHQPVRPKEFGELFADIHPDGLDDVAQRLRLLTSIGAVQRLRSGYYRLTRLGEECANQWRRRAILETLKAPESGLFDDFAKLAIW